MANYGHDHQATSNHFPNKVWSSRWTRQPSKVWDKCTRLINYDHQAKSKQQLSQQDVGQVTSVYLVTKVAINTLREIASNKRQVTSDYLVTKVGTIAMRYAVSKGTPFWDVLFPWALIAKIALDPPPSPPCVKHTP